jgi:hypothetical protein
VENTRQEIQLAGLRPLLSDTLPPGAREVRLWHAVSFDGVMSLLRVRAVGDVVTGELFVYAGTPMDTPPGADAALPAACRLRGRERGRLACAAEFREPVSWGAVLDSLEAHRVWTLPRGADLPRQHEVWDGAGIDVEVRRGSCYRVYSYSNPDVETAPEFRDAAALMQLLHDLRDRWTPRRRPGR